MKKKKKKQHKKTKQTKVQMNKQVYLQSFS